MTSNSLRLSSILTPSVAGAVGIEMAAELKLVHPNLNVTLVHSRDKLLSSEALPDEVKDRSFELLREAKVTVLMSHRLSRTEEIKDDAGKPCLKVHFTNGHTMLADQVSMAVSRSVPTTMYLPSDVLDEEGYVKIQASLAFPQDTPNSSSHFAAGDLVKWSGIKRCGAAMHMGYYTASNIYEYMLQHTGSKKDIKLLELAEIPPMIGLAVGKQAVAYWPEGGMTSGEDVMKSFFGDDLGFSSEYFPVPDLRFPGARNILMANSLLELYETWGGADSVKGLDCIMAAFIHLGSSWFIDNLGSPFRFRIHS